MTAYRDFAPQRLQQRGVIESLKGPTYQTFDDALGAANDWIHAEGIGVVNLETVVLPNLWAEEGTTDVDLRTVSGWANWHQFIRVWYHTR